MKTKRILSLLLAITVMATMLIALPLTGYAAVDASSANTYSTLTSFTFENESLTSVGGTTNIVNNLNNGLIYCSGSTATASKIVSVSESTYTNAYQGQNGDKGKACLVFKAEKAGTVSVVAKDKDSSTNFGDKGVGIYCGSNNYLFYASGLGITGDTTAYTFANLTTVSAPVSANDTVYITDRGGVCNIFEIIYTPVSEDPTITLIPEALNLTPGGSGTINATLENFDGGTTIDWTSSNADVATVVSGENNSATVTVSESAAIGSTATITATANGVTAECTVTVVSPSSYVIIKGNAGLKSLTIKNSENENETYTLNWIRNQDSNVLEASKDILSLDGYSAGRNYYREIKDMPLGKYTYTAEYVTEYYTLETTTGEFEVTSDYVAYTENTDTEGNTTYNITPVLTVSPSKIIGSSGTIDYSAMAGKTVTWEFKTQTGAANEYISLQGLEATNVYSDTNGVFMTVNTNPGGDVTNAKFNSIDRSGDVQVNSGTVLNVPVVPGSVVTFDGIGVTIDGVEYSSGQSYTYTGSENKTISAISTGTYLKTLTVTSPIVLNGLTWNLGTDTGASAELTTYEGKEAIDVKAKNVYTKLDTTYNSGIVTFNTDVYVGTSGFRIYLENASAGTSQPTSADPVITQICTPTSMASINYDATSGGDGTNALVGTTETGWYNINVELDFSNKTVAITAKSPSGVESTGTLETTATELSQIRLITRSSDVYFANMSVKWNPGFGEQDTDSGYYYDGETQVGVIRYLQEYGDATDVTEYGFIFVDATGEIQKISKEAVEQALENGFYGDLTNIPKESFSTEYYAKPYVTINGAEFYADSFSGKVDSEREVNYGE